MDATVHQHIVARLQDIQDVGMVHDFLVKWTGSNERLQPTVTVWSDPKSPVQAVRECVTASLAELVSADQISVVVERVDAAQAGVP